MLRVDIGPSTGLTATRVIVWRADNDEGSGKQRRSAKPADRLAEGTDENGKKTPEMEKIEINVQKDIYFQIHSSALFDKEAKGTVHCCHVVKSERITLAPSTWCDSFFFLFHSRTDRSELLVTRLGFRVSDTLIERPPLIVALGGFQLVPFHYLTEDPGHR